MQIWQTFKQTRYGFKKNLKAVKLDILLDLKTHAQVVKSVSFSGDGNYVT
jgi:hypothetical protein